MTSYQKIYGHLSVFVLLDYGVFPGNNFQSDLYITCCIPALKRSELQYINININIRIAYLPMEISSWMSTLIPSPFASRRISFAGWLKMPLSEDDGV